ncbi:MAG: DUF4390 domain-containing protein [Pseudomarimonas sp.]
MVSNLRHPGVVAILLLLLAACSAPTPDRASISSARALASAGGADLEVVQQLRLSPAMLDALDAGIALRFNYAIAACDGTRLTRSLIELSYSALTRRYSLRSGDGEHRYFARRSGLLAALDRIRLPLSGVESLHCDGVVHLELDLSALPTPLRLPAVLLPGEWKLISPPFAWSASN